MIEFIKSLFSSKANTKTYIVTKCKAMPSAVGMTGQFNEKGFTVTNNKEYRTLIPLEFSLVSNQLFVKTKKLELILEEI